MKILVSSCLLGENCRYKGDNCRNDKVVEFCKNHTVFSVCPEVLGGMSTPRNPSERVGSLVLSSKGADVTEFYNKGAEIALSVAKANNVDLCILKAKSPSCGSGIIYDGSFSGKLTQGFGVTAELLTKNGFKVISENDLA